MKWFFFDSCFFLGDLSISSALVETMRFILHFSYFSFNGIIYNQLSGVAMGSPAAVVYTNIFMFAIEEWHLPSFVTLAKFSGRYIDDIITIQPKAGPVGLLLSLAEDSSTAFDLPSFMVTLNEVSPVRFTCESSYDELLVLDMTLYRDNNGTVSTKTHFKPHNKFLYVRPLSDHPSPTWRALVRGELLRIHRACCEV